MIRLQPLQETDASQDVRALYRSICLMTKTQSPPLLFQYIANYPDYLFYAWERVREVIDSAQFQQGEKQLTTLSDAMISVIYTPSRSLSDFIQTMQGQEHQDILKTASDLKMLNVTLLLVSLAMRESIKGVPIGAKKLPGTISEEQKDEKFFDALIQQTLENTGSALSLEAARMLVPTLGSSLPAVSHYADFFDRIAREMETLRKSEAYLKARVELERMSHTLITGFSTSFGFSYAETHQFLKDKPFVDDLFFLLKDTFPAQYPNALMTASVMHQSLSHT